MLGAGMVAQGAPGIDQVSEGNAQWLSGSRQIQWNLGNVPAGGIAYLSYKFRLPISSGSFSITSGVTASGS